MIEKIKKIIWFPFFMIGVCIAPLVVLILLIMWYNLKEINKIWENLVNNSK